MTSCKGPIGQPGFDLVKLCVFTAWGRMQKRSIGMLEQSVLIFGFFFTGITMFHMQKRGSFDNKSKGKT